MLVLLRLTESHCMGHFWRHSNGLSLVGYRMFLQEKQLAWVGPSQPPRHWSSHGPSCVLRPRPGV